MTELDLDTFSRGVLLGVLIGEGSFGGDGKQPQVTVRMHVRHEALFRWLDQAIPGSRLYGPYNHSGRRYFQWMVRGHALVDELMPLLDDALTPALDGHAADRYRAMCTNYSSFIARTRAAAGRDRVGDP